MRVRDSHQTRHQDPNSSNKFKTQRLRVKVCVGLLLCGRDATIRDQMPLQVSDGWPKVEAGGDSPQRLLQGGDPTATHVAVLDLILHPRSRGERI